MDLAGLAVFPEGWVGETSGQGEAVPVQVWVPRSIAAQLRRTNLGLHGDVEGDTTDPKPHNLSRGLS